MIRRRRDDAHAFHEAWERGLPAHGEVADLVQTAEQLCLGSSAQPSPEFLVSLRERVMAEAETVLIPNPAAWRDPAPSQDVRVVPQRHPARRRLAGLTAAALATAGTVSLVSTSAQALPGEMLYPVKTSVESVQLAMKDDGNERGAYQLDRATERLREAEVVAKDAPSDDQLAGVLDTFTQQARDGSVAMFDEYARSGDPQSIDLVSDFATKATRTLSGFSSDALPSDARAAWESAAEAISAMALESTRLCGSCDEANVDDLVRSVAAAAESTEPEPERPASDEQSASRDERSSSQPPATTPERATPRPTGSATRSPAPSPAPTQAPTRLRDVTDPLIGGLLGDDDQEGLVPGLLGGLLGGGR
ncbi:DUF5667 domain-containing protein [Aeromicrobium sp. CF4.19]|uniref:DUF5667 domain-containing protein n=1 Tax=Aeromicrobium sp. CF4.19 TaxID=3373082 RepID=UPI003EE43F50